MVKGLSKSFQKQSPAVKKHINTIILKKKKNGEDFIALAEPMKGKITFDQKEGLTEDDYEAIGDHEFEHIDFAIHLNNNDKKYLDFIINGNRIEPFTPALMSTLAEQEDAFVTGNFGILPDKRLEYPDEINSIVKEIETREKLGLPTDILNEEEFNRAKRLVDNLHAN